MPWKTWGDAFNSCLRRGYDHGYAAWRADLWEQRRAAKKRTGTERENESQGERAQDAEPETPEK